MSNAGPTFWLIAGPNGVGKTTFAMKSLEAVSGSINFVNLDEIARGLSPLRPAEGEADAARIALSRAAAFIDSRQTFSMETTMAGRTQWRLMRSASGAGMATSLLYFSARSPEICLERIARRVAGGGHDVAEAVVRRRFHRSLTNLPAYMAAADDWRVFEASGPAPRLAAEGRRETIAFRDDTVLAEANPGLRSALA